MSRGQVAFVDDEPQLCRAAEEWLGVCGFAVTTFTDPQRAIDSIAPSDCDCIVTDVRMPGGSGLDLLLHYRAIDPELPVVLLTGHGDVALAVDAMRGGAHDFLEKPYDAEHLVAVLDRAIERRRLGRELQRLRRGGKAGDLETRLVGLSPAIAELRRTILQLADIDVDVLITGETGAGKEVVARALHDFGGRAAGQFVAINCAAIPESVFESEVFGHARGAFTGAVGDRVGKFEFARGGTVFLDEIESMPLALQAKVLRAVQERTVEPLGTNTTRPVDVRFVAATKVDLAVESAAGRFRPDLYFRLSTVEVDVPPLRDRRDDIPLLHALFAGAAAERFRMAEPAFDTARRDALMARDWPGNVRELKAAAERAVLGLGRRGGGAPMSGNDGAPLAERVARFEADLIAQALRDTNGATAEAADRLGLPAAPSTKRLLATVCAIMLIDGRISAWGAARRAEFCPGGAASRR